MKNAPMRRLWIGSGVLLIVLVALGLYIVSSIQATRESLEEMMEAGGEADVAVSEMKTYVGEIGDGTLSYVETDDAEYGEQVEESQTGFDESRTRYDGLVGADGEEGRGEEIDVLYEEYAPLGETMMDDNDEKEAALVRVSEGYAEMEDTLGEIQVNASLDEKGQEAASMSNATDSLEDYLTSYLQEPNQDFLDLASSSTGDFNEALAQFRRLQPTGEERNQADKLETWFDEALVESNDVLALDYSVRRNEEKLSDLRAELEDVLDEEVQSQRNLQVVRAQDTTQALGRTQMLTLLAFAVVLLALAAILFVGSGAAVRVGRWVGRLASRSKVVAGRSRRGDVGVERRLLTVGIILAAAE